MNTLTATSKEDLLYKKIGKVLRDKRNKLDLTQEQLAFRAAMNRTSITNIEKGTQKAPLHVIYQLSEILDIDIFEVLPKTLSFDDDDVKIIGNKDKFEVDEFDKYFR